MTTSITPSYSGSGSGGVLPTTTTTLPVPLAQCGPQRSRRRSKSRIERAGKRFAPNHGWSLTPPIRQEQSGAFVGILLCIGTVAIFWAIVYCMNKWVYEAATQRQASLRHNGHGQGW
ncbi:hypothetical protein G7054_g15204 [Neopestalotiopsis clavispora]|nr:hypothetical protein G7054_g15204 [Neopestalotiopsis clavispora]